MFLKCHNLGGKMQLQKRESNDGHNENDVNSDFFQLFL